MPNVKLTAPRAYAGPVPDGKLTRAEVARRLGVSRTTLRRLEGKSLHPSEGPGGIRFFEEREVEAFQITYRHSRSSASRREDEQTSGDHAAEAFEHFDRGSSTVEVVKALRLHPDHVVALHDAWRRMKQPPAPISDAELAVRAYEMFTSGKSCREVAIELRQSASVVLALRHDFDALNEADQVDLPDDVIAALRRMNLHLPRRQPARALPALIQKICKEFVEQIEQLDPEARAAREAFEELQGKRSA